MLSAMKKNLPSTVRRTAAALLAAMLAGFSCQQSTANTAGSQAPQQALLIGYYLLDQQQINQFPLTGQPAAALLPDAAQAAALSHLNLAFITLNERGECDWEAGVEPARAGRLMAALQTLKQTSPKLRLMVSLGGWAATNDDSPDVQRYRQAAASADGRARLAASCLAFLQRYQLDGLDIDWEYPRSADADHFVSLLQTVRLSLQQAGRQRRQPYQLTLAVAGGAFNLARSYRQLPAIAAEVDYLNLMTYDFHGPWDQQTQHHAHLYGEPGEPLFDNPLPDLRPAGSRRPAPPARFALTADAAVQQYLDAGVPAGKLVLGVPFYGRAFFRTGSGNHGLFQPFVTQAGDLYSEDYRLLPGCQSCLQVRDPRTPGYADISHMLSAGLGYQRFQSEASKAVWLWQPDQRIFVSYEDLWSLKYKVEYMRQQGLAGVMFWHLGLDDARHSLLLGLQRLLQNGQAKQDRQPAGQDQDGEASGGLRYHPD